MRKSLSKGEAHSPGGKRRTAPVLCNQLLTKEGKRDCSHPGYFLRKGAEMGWVSGESAGGSKRRSHSDKGNESRRES